MACEQLHESLVFSAGTVSCFYLTKGYKRMPWIPLFVAHVEPTCQSSFFQKALQFFGRGLCYVWSYLREFYLKLWAKFNPSCCLGHGENDSLTMLGRGAPQVLGSACCPCHPALDKTVENAMEKLCKHRSNVIYSCVILPFCWLFLKLRGSLDVKYSSTFYKLKI